MKPQHTEERSAADLPAALAQDIATRLQAAIEARGQALLVVSGGNSPIALFKALRVLPIAWHQDTATLADADVTDPAVTYQYQWYRGADPVGSGRDYVLTQADVGQPISVVVSYHDGFHVETGATTPALTASIPAGNFASSFTRAAACSARAVAMIGNGRAEPDRGCSSSMLPSSASSLRMS